MCLPGTAEAVRERIEEEGAPTVTRGTLLAGGAAAAAAMFPGAALGGGRGSGGPSRRFKRMQDLTHLFRAGFPVFGGPEPTRETFFNFPTDGFYSQRWTFTEHSGTHMDAPGHFVPGGRLTPAIEADELMRPLVVVDIRRKAASDPNAMVTVDDLRRFERGSGRIPRGAIRAADGTALARSVRGRDGTYTRRYPLGDVFAQTVGYSFLKSGLRRKGQAKKG